MTLTLELSPEREQALQSIADREGVAVAVLASQLLDEAIEDAIDVAEADRIMAEAKPEDWIPWEQVKAEAGLD